MASDHRRVVAVFTLAAVAPLFYSAGSGVLNDIVLAAVYVVMALGLNIIVGFAGLLDLGYVAFFAIGAYRRPTSGRASGSTPGPTGRASPSSPARPSAGTPGIHVNFLLILALAVAATAVAGA